MNKSALLGLATRKERWALTWKGWLLLLFAFFVVGALFVRGVHPFLAVTDRVDAEILVVEGWISTAAIRGAAAEYTNRSYRRAFTTGGPVPGSGPYNMYKTSANVGAAQLQAAGVAPASVQMVPSRVSQRDRTYNAAAALKHWMQEKGEKITRINVVTEGVHARRSRLLYQKALGKDIAVGIVSVPSAEYDPSRWWRYSEGVKEVITEAVAYLYVRFFFHPEQ